MKILQIGSSHPRNQEFFLRICNKLGYEYDKSVEINCSGEGYDLIWSPGKWFGSKPDNSII